MYDHLDFLSAVNVYLDGFAAASTYAIRKGTHDAGRGRQLVHHLLAADGLQSQSS